MLFEIPASKQDRDEIQEVIEYFKFGFFFE
jgi:hypothetical protein